MLMPPLLYKKKEEDIIPGKLFKGLVKYGDRFIYERLRVYADKTIAGTYLLYNLPINRAYKHMSKFMPKIKKQNCVGFLGNGSDENMNAISFEDFKYLVNKNLVTLNYKGKVYLDLVTDDPIIEGNLSMNVNMNISNKDFIKMIDDVFCKLNDQPDSTRLFMNTLCEFLLAPKEKKESHRKILYKAYINLPEFQREEVYVPDIFMKGKDPIGDILYKRKGRKDFYDEFVEEYDDIYFEKRYKDLGGKNTKYKYD